jgi:SHS2 domain-containing protein
MSGPTGYQEIEHTADWALRVWAPDLPTLFAQAAKGMYALMDTALCPEPRSRRSFELQADDEESLLVSFLNELLYFGELEDLGFDRFEVRINRQNLRAEVEGAPFEARKKEIKAVTYHNLAIRKNDESYVVEIVFDV